MTIHVILVWVWVFATLKSRRKNTLESIYQILFSKYLDKG